MSRVPFNFTNPVGAPEGFFYDRDKPTYYTEMLSYQIMRFLAALTAGGAFYDVSQDVDLAATENAVNEYLANFHDWVLDSAGRLSAHLTEKSGSRSQIALAAAPTLALAGGASLAVLPPAIVAKMATSIINDIAESTTRFKADMRAADFVRLFDRAFFEQSWFGNAVDRPYLAAIEGVKRQLSIEHGANEGLSLGDLLQLALTGADAEAVPEGETPPTIGVVDALMRKSKEDLIKLICQITLDKGLSIESVDFGVDTKS